MKRADLTFDALVLGGGPSGSAAAAFLARKGHRVALLTRPSPPAPALAESIPPSARKLLAAVGLLDAVEGAGFFPNLGNTVWWAGGGERAEPFAPEAAGVHVERRRLEAVLLDEARRAGVTVVVGSGARRPLHTGDGWRIEAPSSTGAPVHGPPDPARSPGGPPSVGAPLRAPWLLDATGRSGVMARRGLRIADEGPGTLALVRRWAGPPSGSPEAHHTLVESYADGWAWSVPLGRGERCVTAMVDPELTALERGGSLARAYDAELAKTSHLGRRLEGWEPAGRVWACPASLYGARAFTGDGFLLVGDAGSFIDPLSSYGVKKALASAWLAAVAVHTALVDPAMAGVALAHHDAREREVHQSYRRISAGFLREAEEAYRHPYWSRRLAAARGAGGDGEPGPSGDPADSEEVPWSAGAGDAVVPHAVSTVAPYPVPLEAVRAAFEWIRAQERLALRPGSGAGWVERTVVEDERIVRRRHLQPAGSGEAVRFVRGVELERLCDLAPRHAEVPELWEAYNRAATPVPLPDFLAALATAVAAGAVEGADGAVEGAERG